MIYVLLAASVLIVYVLSKGFKPSLATENRRLKRQIDEVLEENRELQKRIEQISCEYIKELRKKDVELKMMVEKAKQLPTKIKEVVDDHLCGDLTRAFTKARASTAPGKEMKKKSCKHPGCTNYKKGAKKYCCVACSFDHKDWLEVRRGKNRSKTSTIRR